MSEDIDKQILEELRQNARIPITVLAQIVGRSRTAVQARLSRLERSHRILGYTIKEPSIAETDGIGAIVLVTLEVRNQTDALLKAVGAMPQVASCIGVIGDHDYALLIRQIDKPELEHVLVRLYKIEGVKRTETIMALFREF